MEREAPLKFFKITSNSYEIQNSLHQEFIKEKGNCQLLDSILNLIIEQGKKEGCIRKEIPGTHVYMIFVSNFISFFIFLGHEEQIEDVNRESTKEFLYQNMMKILN